MSSMRERAVQGLQTGDVFTVTRTFSREETEAFGHLTKDYNPVHYDEDFARIKGFPQLILHGLLTAGMVCQVGGQLAWLATGMNFCFQRPVFFGDTITCTVTVTSVEERGWAKAEALYTNQRGEVVVSATLEGQVPREESQQALGERLAQGDPFNPLS